MDSKELGVFPLSRLRNVSQELLPRRWVLALLPSVTDFFLLFTLADLEL